MTKCCCNYGAAVSGEYPEFGCAKCPIHKASLGETEVCKRHAKETEPRDTSFAAHCEGYC